MRGAFGLLRRFIELPRNDEWGESTHNSVIARLAFGKAWQSKKSARSANLYKNKRRNLQNLLKTNDGSFSLYSDIYKDFYHSTKDGAILETLYKHIIPTFGLLSANRNANPRANHNAKIANHNANLITNLSSKNPIKILDICFGLGYNALFSLAFAKRANIAISVHSVELHLLENLRNFAYPKILLHYLPLKEILDPLFLRGAWGNEKLSIYLHKGDAKDYIKNLAHQKPQNSTFDIIYQDAFSPTKNAELWDLVHFQNLFALLKNNGAISTYSTSKKVREICQNVGFEVYNMRCGNLKNGTILRKDSRESKIRESKICESKIRESHATQSQNATKSIKIECISLDKVCF